MQQIGIIGTNAMEFGGDKLSLLQKFALKGFNIQDDENIVCVNGKNGTRL